MHHKSTYIPSNLPRPTESSPRPQGSTYKSSSSQTDGVVLIKDENLILPSALRIGQNDAGMRRDYSKAVNYINRCHEFINTLIEKNNSDRKSLFRLPMITNFIPVFVHLTGRTQTKQKRKANEVNKKVEKKSDRKSRNSFGAKKLTARASTNTSPAGDGSKSPRAQDEPDTNQFLSFLLSEFIAYVNNNRNNPRSLSPTFQRRISFDIDEPQKMSRPASFIVPNHEWEMSSDKSETPQNSNTPFCIKSPPSFGSLISESSDIETDYE